MNRTRFTKLLLSFLFVLLISSCQSSTEPSTGNNSNTGDWPSYTFEELVSNSDLVVYGKITDTKNLDGDPPSQESNLNVLKVLKGDETNKTISLKLTDPSYYVSSDSKYVMFLEDTGSYYTQKSYNSLLIEKNGVISSSLQRFSGEFTIDEVQNQISSVMAKK